MKRAKGYYFKPKQSNPYIEFLKRRSASFGFSPTLSDADQLFHDDWMSANVEAETNFHSHAGRNESMEGSRVASQVGTEALIHSTISGGRNQSASVSNEALFSSLAGHAHTRLLENEVNAFANILNPIQPKRRARKKR